MRPSKHKTLAKAMKKIITDIDDHYQKILDHMNFIQLFFFETQYVEGRPLMTDSAMRVMTLTYALASSYLSETEEVRSVILLPVKT